MTAAREHGNVHDTKLFVLDTNVILHDAGCLRSFEEHDVAIPITVLEELDRFKKGNEDINFQARAFLRRLDELTGDLLSAGGAPLGDELGRVRVVIGRECAQQLQQTFLQDNPDHRILDAALTVQQHEPGRKVILVSKDTNLRMKAKSLGLIAQDYKNDKVETHEKLYTGKRFISGMPCELVDALYRDGRVSATSLAFVDGPRPNENFVLRNGSKSVLATYRASDQSYGRVEKQSAYGVLPRNAEQSFAIRALLDDDIKLVTLVGKAGSGKTLLALAAALECKTRYRQILLARPVVPLSNRDLGFLPGDIGAKLDPYMHPLYDNLGVIKHQHGDGDSGSKVQEWLEQHKLEVAPLPYIRGRSLQRMFFIIDEAQNLTPHEVKTIITRAGEGTKVVFTGDIHQIDHPYLDSLSNGLSYLISRMVGQSIYAHVTLEKGERSALAELASDLL
ncbi:MAG: PhoH family protein [Planctomycetaceae bacterium]|nr:PhoH family protein [Planctomycetaceae bacterium]